MYGSLYRANASRRIPVAALGASVAAITIVGIGIAVACRGDGDRQRGDARRSASGSVVTTSPAVSSPMTSPTSSIRAAIPSDVSYETADSAFTGRRYSDATAMFDMYTKRRPDNPWGFYMLGLSAWKAGELDRARAAFETALDRDPRHVKSMVNLSRVLLDEHLDDDALQRVNSAIALDSGNGDAWRVFGRVQARLGHRDVALDGYRMAIVLDSTDTWSMNNTGLLLIGAGRYADAIGPLARAVQLDAGVPAFHNNLGIALERTGYATAAAESFGRAIALDSGYVKAKVSLVRVDGRPDAPGLDPLDLDGRSGQFVQSLVRDRGTVASESSPGKVPSAGDSTAAH